MPISPELGVNFAQHSQEARAVAHADDAVEILIVPPGAHREASQQLMASRRERQLIAAAVALQAATRNQPAPLEIVERWSERRLVAAVCTAERRLADTGIAPDQHQQRKSTRTEI